MVPSSVGFNTHCFSEGLHGVDILVELVENLDCVISPKVHCGALCHGFLAVFIVIALFFFFLSIGVELVERCTAYIGRQKLSEFLVMMTLPKDAFVQALPKVART